jgi:hypothetical protein
MLPTIFFFFGGAAGFEPPPLPPKETVYAGFELSRLCAFVFVSFMSFTVNRIALVK